jgi:hypothetical protein
MIADAQFLPGQLIFAVSFALGVGVIVAFFIALNDYSR